MLGNSITYKVQTGRAAHILLRANDLIEFQNRFLIGQFSKKWNVLQTNVNAYIFLKEFSINNWNVFEDEMVIHNITIILEILQLPISKVIIYLISNNIKSKLHEYILCIYMLKKLTF